MVDYDLYLYGVITLPIVLLPYSHDVMYAYGNTALKDKKPYNQNLSPGNQMFLCGQVVHLLLVTYIA